MMSNPNSDELKNAAISFLKFIFKHGDTFSYLEESGKPPQIRVDQRTWLNPTGHSNTAIVRYCYKSGWITAICQDGSCAISPDGIKMLGST